MVLILRSLLLLPTLSVLFKTRVTGISQYFKNYSDENLRKILNTCNLKDADIEDILNKKKNKEYQVACVKYFEGKFPGVLGEGIGIHPNKYFNSAMKVLKGGNKRNGNDKENNGEKDNNNNNNVKDNSMDIVEE